MNGKMKTIHEAYIALTSNRVRSFLMIVIIAVGVGSLTAVMTIGKGTRDHILELVSEHGLDMIMVRPGGTEQIFAAATDRTVVALSTDDTEAISRSIPNVLRTSSVQNERDWDVVFGDQTIKQRIFAVEPGWDAIRRRGGFRYGGMFTEEDEQRAERVAVLASRTSTTLFGDENPVGKTIRIGNDPYRVVGVFNSIGGGAGESADWDFRIVIPFSTGMKRLFGRPYLEQIIVQVRDINQLADTAEQMRGLLRQQHGIAAAAPDDFFVRTPQDVEEAAMSTHGTLNNLLVATSMIALFIGGIIIMNVMLMSVSERVQEIGLRRAAGARRRDIFRQFLTEAMLTALAGGAIGGLVGITASLLLSDFAKLTWIPFAVALVSSCAVALVFGIYPARKAATVDLIVSLRNG